MHGKFQALTVTLNPAVDRTLTIPGFSTGNVNRVERQETHAGGKGVNVASFLADFGFRIAVTGFLGTDNATVFEEAFQKKAIQDHFIRLPGETRTGLKIVDPRKHMTTDINFPGFEIQDAMVETLCRVLERLASPDLWVVMAGSVPPGVPDNVYSLMIDRVKARGAKVALDTSGNPLREALVASPTLIKPNLEELREVAGRSLTSQDDILEAARDLIEQGIETVIVSMGKNGAIFAEREETVLATSPDVPVVSTVGAGDAMVAGTVAAAMTSQTRLEERAILASAFALNAIGRLDYALPDKTTLNRLKRSITLTRL